MQTKDLTTAAIVKHEQNRDYWFVKNITANQELAQKPTLEATIINLRDGSVADFRLDQLYSPAESEEEIVREYHTEQIHIARRCGEIPKSNLKDYSLADEVEIVNGLDMGFRGSHFEIRLVESWENHRDLLRSGRSTEFINRARDRQLERACYLTKILAFMKGHKIAHFPTLEGLESSQKAEGEKLYCTTSTIHATYSRECRG